MEKLNPSYTQIKISRAPENDQVLGAHIAGFNVLAGLYNDGKLIVKQGYIPPTQEFIQKYGWGFSGISEESGRAIQEFLENIDLEASSCKEVFNALDSYHGQIKQYNNGMFRSQTSAICQTINDVLETFKVIRENKNIESIGKYLKLEKSQEQSPISLLNTFQSLVDNGELEHNSTVDVTIKDNGDWCFSFNIGDEEIYSSSLLQDTNDTPYALFCAKKAVFDFKNATHEYQKELELKSYIMCNIQCMSDKEDVQKFIKENLTNEKYSSQNFMGVDSSNDGTDTFIAHFKEGDLVFSNRASSRKEFRGQLLKEALKADNYNNLGELCGQGHLTPTDSMFVYLATPYKMNLIDLIGDIGLTNYAVNHTLHETKIGNTTVRALFGIPRHQPGDDFEIIDKPKALLGNDVVFNAHIIGINELVKLHDAGELKLKEQYKLPPSQFIKGYGYGFSGIDEKSSIAIEQLIDNIDVNALDPKTPAFDKIVKTLVTYRDAIQYYHKGMSNFFTSKNKNDRVYKALDSTINVLKVIKNPDYNLNSTLVGFGNLGNTCYANSSLKFLLLSMGKEALLDHISTLKSENNTEEKNTALRYFESIVKDLFSGTPIKIETLRSLFSALQELDGFKCSREINLNL